MQNNVSLLTALGAGFLSFLSPCVLPLIPGYISFISGASLADLKSGRAGARVFWSSIFFVLGFSCVFILLGASATLLGRFLLDNLRIFNKFAGLLLIVLGLHLTGLINLNFFNAEKRIHLTGLKSSYGMAFVIGLAFAFGWSPCIGPLLAAILAVAGNQETVGQGILLLTFYSLGLGLPFIATALALEKFLVFFSLAKKYFRWIEIGSGVLLIILGLLIFTEKLTALAYLLIK